MAGIDAALDAYAAKRTLGPEQRSQLASAGDEIRRIYRTNFFPEHGVDYRAFVNNLGHFEHKGCERCHDGRHKAAGGGKPVTTACDACHLLVGQASGVKEVAAMKYGQFEFEHPEEPLGPGRTCSSCHALDNDEKEKEQEPGKGGGAGKAQDVENRR
jgi:hypothetical protein